MLLLDIPPMPELIVEPILLLAIPVVLVVLLVYVFYIRKKRREIMRQ